MRNKIQASSIIHSIVVECTTNKVNSKQDKYAEGSGLEMFITNPIYTHIVKKMRIPDMPSFFGSSFPPW